MPPAEYRQFGSTKSLISEDGMKTQDKIMRTPPPRRKSPFIRILLRVIFPAALLVCVLGYFYYRTNGNEQTISIQVSQVPFNVVMNLIEEKTKCRFCYTQEQLALSRPVTANIMGEPLSKALQICFREQPFTFVLHDTSIIIQSARK